MASTGKGVSFNDSSFSNSRSVRHSTPVGGTKKMNRSPVSPRRGMGSLRETSPSKSAFASEIESNTIQKQRKELQLLIVELKDRDRELNEMVASHQKQLMAWEEDRQRVLALEQRCARIENELATKNENIKVLSARLRNFEAEDQSKTEALQQSQLQLSRLTEQSCTMELQVQELEEKNRELNNSMRDMSSTIGELEAKEQELLTMVRLKDKDLMDASNHISELATRLKMLDFHHKQLQQSEGELKRQLTESNDRGSELRREVDRLRSDNENMSSEAEERAVDIQRARQEIADLSKDLTLSGEREKRKDEVIALQRSKMERADAELTSLRQAYDRQLRDLSLLHLNLESSKELIAKQQASFNEENVSSSSPEKGGSRPTSRLASSPSSRPTPMKTPDTSPIRSPVTATNSLPVSSIDEFTLPGSRDLEASPTSKLHRLLEESRNMVSSLEKVTLSDK